MKRFVVLVTILMVYLYSCKKEAIDINTFGDCNEQRLTDSLAISTHLIGN